LKGGRTFAAAEGTSHDDETVSCNSPGRVREHADITAELPALNPLTVQLSRQSRAHAVELIDALMTKKSLFHSITLSDQTIAVVGDLAVVRHHFAADAVSNGKPVQPRIRSLPGHGTSRLRKTWSMNPNSTSFTEVIVGKVAQFRQVNRNQRHEQLNGTYNLPK
jgi:hypothetical protein